MALDRILEDNSSIELKFNQRTFWGIVFFAYFFFFFYLGRFEGSREIPTRIFTPILLFFSFMIGTKKGITQFRPFIFFIIFFLYCILSGLWARSFGTYIRQIQMMAGLLAFYQIFNVFQNKFNIFNYCLLGISIGSIFLFFVGFAITETDFQKAYLDVTADETFKSAEDNPNTLGTLYLIGISSIITFSKSLHNWVYRLITYIPALLLFYGIILTASRSNLISATILIFLDIIFEKRFKSIYKLIIVVSILLFFWFFVYNSFIDTAVGIRLLETGTSFSDMSRKLMIEESFETFLNNPIIGVGIGNFVIVSSLGLYAHNDFLEVLACLGVVGFIVYLSYLSSIFRRFIMFYKFNKTFSIGFISFFISYFILGIFGVYFTDTLVQFQLIMFVIYSQYNYNLKS